MQNIVFLGSLRVKLMEFNGHETFKTSSIFMYHQFTGVYGCKLETSMRVS
jgi:hypothetical protein